MLWRNTVVSPVPQIWGELLEICYKENGSVIKDTGIVNPPEGVFVGSSDTGRPVIVPFGDVTRWRKIT